MRSWCPRQTRQLACGGAFILHLLMYPVVTGCNRSSDALGRPTLEEGTLIAVIGPSEGHPQWPGIRGGAQRFLSGVPTLRGQFETPRESTDLSLRAAVRRVLEHRPRAVCLYVADPELAATSIDLIAAEKVLLVTMGQRCPDARIYGHVGVSLPEAAGCLGENLARIAAGRRSYLLLHERGLSAEATECHRRFVAGAQRHYGITALQQENAAEGDRSPADLVEELLGRFPHAGLVVTLSPDVWLAARAGWDRRLRQLNRDFRFATLAAPPRLWQQLGTPAEPGDAAALVGPLDGEIGYAAVHMAVQALVGTEAPLTYRTIECELVTAENLADFARRYAAAANGLDVSGYLP